MGAVVAHAFAVIPASTSGDIDITTSDLGGLTPKGAIIYFNYSTSATQSVNQTPVANVIGLSVFDGTRSRCAVHWNRAEDSLVARRAQYTDCVIQFMSGFNTARGTATASFITNGIRLNFSSAMTSAGTVSIIFFAGASVTAYANDVTCPHGSGSGTISVTDPAFQPDLVYFFGTTATDFPQTPINGQVMSHGWALNKTGIPQACLGAFNSYVSSVQAAGGALFENVAFANTNQDQMYRAFRVSAFDADGFDLAYEPGSQSTNDLNGGYLAIDLDGTDFDLDILSFTGGPASLSTSSDFSSQFAMYSGATYDSLIDGSTIGSTTYGGHNADEGRGGFLVGLATNGSTVRDDCWQTLCQTGAAAPTLRVSYTDEMYFQDNDFNAEKVINGVGSFGASSVTWSIDSSSQTTTTRLFVLSIATNGVTLNGNDVTSGTPALTSGTLGQSHVMGTVQFRVPMPHVAKVQPEVLKVSSVWIGSVANPETVYLDVDANAEAVLVFVTGVGTGDRFDTATVTLDGNAVTYINHSPSTVISYQIWMGYRTSFTTGTGRTLVINNPEATTLVTASIVSLRGVDTADLIEDSAVGEQVNLTAMTNATEAFMIKAIATNGVFARTVDSDTYDERFLASAFGSTINAAAAVFGFDYNSTTAYFDFTGLLSSGTAAVLVNPVHALPAITLKSILNGNDVTTGAPTVSSANFLQDHVLDGNPITTPAAVITEGAIGQHYVLEGYLGGITTGAPTVPAADLVESHGFTSTGITTGAPTLTSGTLAQDHILDATDITTGTPIVPSPVLAVATPLDGNDVTTGAPTVSSATFIQGHVLDATDVTTGAPTFPSWTLVQSHVLDATDVTTGAPDLGTFDLVESHLFTSTGITTGAPTLTAGNAIQHHVLGRGYPIVGIPPDVPGGEVFAELTGISPFDWFKLEKGVQFHNQGDNWIVPKWTFFFFKQDRRWWDPTERALIDTSGNNATDFTVRIARHAEESDGYGRVRVLVPDGRTAIPYLTGTEENYLDEDPAKHSYIATYDDNTGDFYLYFDGTQVALNQGPGGNSDFGAETAWYEATVGMGQWGAAFYLDVLTPAQRTELLSRVLTLGDGEMVLRQSHVLTGNDFATDSPTLTSGSIAQDHVFPTAELISGVPDLTGWVFIYRVILDAADLTGGTPVLSEGSMTGTHPLIGQGGGIFIDAVFVPTPDLVEHHLFTAAGVTTAAVTITSGTIAQDHVLDGLGMTAIPFIPTPDLIEHNGLTGSGEIVAGAPTVSSANFSQSHVLDATDVTTGVPVVSQGVLVQSHVTDGNDVTTGVPVVSQGVLVQSHVTDGNDVTTGVPVVSQGTLVQSHVLDGNDVTTGAPDMAGWTITVHLSLTGARVDAGAPTVSSGTLSQSHVLTGARVDAGAPTLTAGNLNTDQGLDGDPITTGAPDLGTFALIQDHTLDGNLIVTGNPVIPVPSLVQFQVLDGNGITTGASYVIPGVGGTLNQDHVLTGVSLVTGNPVIPVPSLVQSHELSGTRVDTQRPTLSVGTIAQDHVLNATDITTGAPILPIPSFSGYLVLRGDPVTTGHPTVTSTALRQDHVLDGLGFATGTPTVTSGSAGESVIRFPAGDLVSGTPVLTLGDLVQHHVFAAGDLVSGTPVLTEGRMNLQDLLDPARTLVIMTRDRTLVVRESDRGLVAGEVDRSVVTRRGARQGVVIAKVDRTLIPS